MAKPTSTKDKTAVSANPSLVEWPQDAYGVAHGVKREILRLAGRVNGQKDKALLALETLEVGIAHLKARYKAQVAERERTSQSTDDRLKRDEWLKAKRLNRAIDNAQANLDSLKGE